MAFPADMKYYPVQYERGTNSATHRTSYLNIYLRRTDLETRTQWLTQSLGSSFKIGAAQLRSVKEIAANNVISIPFVGGERAIPVWT